MKIVLVFLFYEDNTSLNSFNKIEPIIIFSQLTIIRNESVSWITDTKTKFFNDTVKPE